MSLNKSVVCPVVVGRAEDLAVLNRLAEQAAQGQAQVALIAGEAGLGKSRLVAESLGIARRLGSGVLQGNCFETDRSLPYAPWLDLLRDPQLKQGDPTKRAPQAAELATLLAELAAAHPAAAAAALEPEQEKRRLFQALARFLIERSGQPLLVVIEDLHWCDDTSLEFLLYFARQIRDRPILLLLTYRNDEVTSSLSHFLAELDRERLSTELVLTRLSAGEVDAMLRLIFELDRPVRGEFMSVLYALTEGNPFFVEEILKALIVAGGIFYSDGTWDRKPIEELNIPRSIHDAVRRRAERLSAPSREVLSLAAVIGQRFDFPLLQRLSARPEAELLQIVKELIAVQLILEESGDRFAFRHALTREAIYSQLIERERRALHQKIGEAIELPGGEALDEHAASLAYHFHQAQAWQKAMPYAQLAAQKAQAVQAPRSAVEYLSYAIEAARQLALPPSTDLHRQRAAAHGLLGDFELARADYEAALQAAHAAADRAQEWRVLLDLGLLWAGRDYAETGAYYQRAYELASALDDPEMRAHALNHLGNWNVNVERPVEGLQYHAEALQLFRHLGDRRGLAETLDLLGMANYIRGDLVQSEAHYQGAVEIFRELGDRQRLASSQASRMLNSSRLQSGMGVLARSDLAEPWQSGQEALRLAREIGWRSGEAYALIILGNYHGLKGQYRQAFDQLKTGLAIAEEIEHSQWIVYAWYCLGALHLDVLDLPRARQQLEAALALAGRIGSRWWITNVSGYLALTYLLEQAPAKAAALLDTTLGDAQRTGAVNIQAFTLGQRLCWYARAELALARREPAAALRIVEQLLAASANASEAPAIPRLALLQAEALMALKRSEAAEGALSAALQAAQQEAEKPLLWRIQAAWGRFYQGQGERQKAAEAYLAGQAIVIELAQEIGDPAERENFQAQAAALIPPARLPSARQAAKQQFSGLTVREREVAAMIADGRSNRDMAEALVVGERTIESHVSSILAKLGYSSRAQIAAWAVEKGLPRHGPS